FELPHGEAVAIGMALDVIYSRRQGYLEPASAERVLRLLERLGFRLFARELLLLGQDQSLSVLRGLDEFREHLGGQLTITLLREIGVGFEVHEMSQPQIVASIQELQARQTSHPRLEPVPTAAP
ncbi:MAG TPA: hypothetical protein VNT26_03075, partial [Candidatus Sulfotelmatobacter sp.]|nr:hypothetical protein [Candidatus Sulfotelmatobacter sp.]